MVWDPGLYEKYAGPRMRPGLDLIARIVPPELRRIYDLGCGPGRLTACLAERWTQAHITGVDSSSEMLAKAREDYPALSWVKGEIADWSPDEPPDLIFSNAALHWLGDHARLFPRLLGALAPGGVLAVQMPRNFDAPSHTLIADVIRERDLSRALPIRGAPVAHPETYYDILAPHAASLEIWESTYLQTLEGEDPVLEFVRATALRPVIEALAGEERDTFIGDYRERLRVAYPRRTDGVTLFPFRRLFIVAIAME
ncbi:MAG: methyltransferase domain-containing protein [Alphaproteobacteria bacterium]|nr:methyltransferase domain-containing protein [Alphaproteobacteria bacterium]